MKKLYFIGFFLLFFLAGYLTGCAPAHAADCTKTCVEVRREGGELVISAQRDPAPVVRARPTSAPTPAPTPTSTRKARISRNVKPRVQPKFSDQIRELLPTNSFSLLPRRGALIYEPLLIRAYGCGAVAKRLSILDTTVDLHLVPYVEWSWGDGQVERWGVGAERGAHIYSRPGKVQIQMRCYWEGSYRTPHSTWSPIPQGIVSIAQQSIELFRAQVFFTE